MPNIGEAFARPYGDADADRRRPRLRPRSSATASASRAARSATRCGSADPAARPRRAAAPHARAARPLPGLLLRARTCAAGLRGGRASRELRSLGVSAARRVTDVASSAADPPASPRPSRCAPAGVGARRGPRARGRAGRHAAPLRTTTGFGIRDLRRVLSGPDVRRAAGVERAVRAGAELRTAAPATGWTATGALARHRARAAVERARRPRRPARDRLPRAAAARPPRRRHRPARRLTTGALQQLVHLAARAARRPPRRRRRRRARELLRRAHARARRRQTVARGDRAAAPSDATLPSRSGRGCAPARPCSRTAEVTDDHRPRAASSGVRAHDLDAGPSRRSRATPSSSPATGSPTTSSPARRPRARRRARAARAVDAALPHVRAGRVRGGQPGARRGDGRRRRAHGTSRRGGGRRAPRRHAVAGCARAAALRCAAALDLSERRRPTGRASGARPLSAARARGAARRCSRDPPGGGAAARAAAAPRDDGPLGIAAGSLGRAASTLPAEK